MEMDSSHSLDPYIPNETQEDRYSRLRAALSVLLCVLAVILLFVFIGLMVIRSTGVGHIIRHIDFVGVFEESTVGIQPSHIVYQINELPFSDVELTLYDIEEFIKLEAVTDELDDIISTYAMAFTRGNLDYSISAEEVIAIARRLEPELYDFFGYRLAEEDLDDLVMTLDDIVDFDALSVDGIIVSVMEEFDFDLTVPLVLISPVIVWIAGFVTIALLAFIFFRKRKNPISASIAVGIPVALTGSITLLTGVVIGTNPTMLGNTSLQFVKIVERPIDLATRYGLAFTVAGAAIIIVAYVFKKVAQRIKDNKTEQDI